MALHAYVSRHALGVMLQDVDLLFQTGQPGLSAVGTERGLGGLVDRACAHTHPLFEQIIDKFRLDLRGQLSLLDGLICQHDRRVQRVPHEGEIPVSRHQSGKAFPKLPLTGLLPLELLLEARLLLEQWTHLVARGELRRRSRHGAGEQPELVARAHVDALHRGVHSEQHRRDLLRRHLDEVVASKLEQRRHLVGDLIIVDGQADAAGAPRPVAPAGHGAPRRPSGAGNAACAGCAVGTARFRRPRHGRVTRPGAAQAGTQRPRDPEAQRVCDISSISPHDPY